MATGNAVLTAKIGPGNTVTSLAVPDVKRFEIDYEKLTLKLESSSDPKKTQYYDIAADTTYTLVLTGTNFVLTVS